MSAAATLAFLVIGPAALLMLIGMVWFVLCGSDVE